MVDIEIAPMGDRRATVDEVSGFWPPFMTRDPTGAFFYSHYEDLWPEFTLLAVDGDGAPAGKAHSVPVFHEEPIGDGLPEGGWDWAIRSAVHDRLWGQAPTMVSALEIVVRPDLRGTGLSARMLTAMRDNAARLGFADLVAPIRPTGKHRDPRRSIDDYAAATRPDGLPVDPWLRVHVRAGGRILNVAHTSMVMAGTLAQWREWTGLPFDTTGPVLVPEALVPLHCDVDQDLAVYVEPNIWVHHRTGA